MGANVWQRDVSGSGTGTTFKIGPTPVQHPARPGKRKLVWTKDQQDQPATPAASVPGPASHRNGDAPTTSYTQHDHFEKRSRLNEGAGAPHNGHYRDHDHQQNHRPFIPRAETKQQQSGAASQDPVATQQQRMKEAELAELKRRIQKHEAQLAAQKVQCVMSLASDRVLHAFLPLKQFVTPCKASAVTCKAQCWSCLFVYINTLRTARNSLPQPQM